MKEQVSKCVDAIRVCFVLKAEDKTYFITLKKERSKDFNCDKSYQRDGGDERRVDRKAVIGDGKVVTGRLETSSYQKFSPLVHHRRVPWTWAESENE